MQYMLLIYGDPSNAPQSEEEHEALFHDFAAWSGELHSRGVVVTGNPLAPTTSATTVRVRDGRHAITDGPFAEVKEYLGGFLILKAESLDEALEVAKRCPGAKYGSVEIRPIVEM